MPGADPPDIAKADLFRELGYGGDAEAYERALREEGLSRPEKPRISTAKADRVAECLRRRFLRVCHHGDCRRDAPGRAQGRAIVEASMRSHCEVCAGSVNHREIGTMIEACRRAGLRRLVIVGGSPALHKDLASAIGDSLETRMIDGTARRTLKEARADTEWADLVVIWGSTMLDHKVSTLYRGDARITVTKRGIPELAREVACFADNHPRPG
jgi:hypothetical protein